MSACSYYRQSRAEEGGGERSFFSIKAQMKWRKKILIADRVRCQYESPLALPQAKILHESLPALRASIKHSL